MIRECSRARCYAIWSACRSWLLGAHDRHVSCSYVWAIILVAALLFAAASGSNQFTASPSSSNAQCSPRPERQLQCNCCTESFAQAGYSPIEILQNLQSTSASPKASRFWPPSIVISFVTQRLRTCSASLSAATTWLRPTFAFLSSA